MYYHVDYVGAPRNSKFQNVSQIQRMWEQLQLTYSYGVDKLWILNVGDLKPMEFPIDFWFKMAWNPSQFNASNLMAYTESFCRQQFGEKCAKEAARILNLQCKYAHRRTPEQLDARTFNLFSGEWKERVDEYDQLARRSNEFGSFNSVVEPPLRKSASVKIPCRVIPKHLTPNGSSRAAIARPMRPKPAMTAVVPSRSPQCSARAERGHMGPFQKNPRVHARRKPRTVSEIIGP